jgi:FkbM family methyltransferase
VELHANTHAHFTKWVVSEGLLEKPFVLVDVGVQGGEGERWQALGDHLVLHGFDAIEEVIGTLKIQRRSHPNRHYHWTAAGKIDGERTLYFDAGSPFSSSMYQPSATSRFSDANTVAQPRPVRVRRLDTLLAEGVIPPADFLKVDVEGYEKDVLLGATELLKSALGFEAETAFTVSSEYRNTHFGTLQDIALANHQRTFDVEFNRVPRASFQRALARENRPPVADYVSVGRPATVNVLFCRDPIEELESAPNYATPPPPLGIDGLIKQIIVYELYGLNDVAVDTAERLADRIGARIDVDKAVRLLADPDCRRNPAVARIRELEARLAAERVATAARVEDLETRLAAERVATAARVEELETQLAAERVATAAQVEELKTQLAEEKSAAVARIRQLEAQFETHGQAHAAAMAEASRLLATEKDAVAARIRELEKRFEDHQQAYQAYIRTTVAERDALILERNALIFELQRPTALLRALIPRPVKERLAGLLPGWKRKLRRPGAASTS